MFRRTLLPHDSRRYSQLNKTGQFLESMPKTNSSQSRVSNEAYPRTSSTGVSLTETCSIRSWQTAITHMRLAKEGGTTKFIAKEAPT